MLTVVRKLCGQEAMGPRDVCNQAIERTGMPISPSPTNPVKLRVFEGWMPCYSILLTVARNVLNEDLLRAVGDRTPQPRKFRCEVLQDRSQGGLCVIASVRCRTD